MPACSENPREEGYTVGQREATSNAVPRKTRRALLRADGARLSVQGLRQALVASARRTALVLHGGNRQEMID